jgi:PAS domain S-box-containing protein
MLDKAVDFSLLFNASPLPRLVVTQAEKDHFFVLKANKAAIHYFCPDKEKDCQIDGMALPDFIDTTNKTHILQAMTVCHDSQVPVTIQILPKKGEVTEIQTFLLSAVQDDDVTFIDMQSQPPSSDQAAIEQERDDAISMFTTVFDVSDVGFTVVDHHGRFVRINQTFTRLTGWESIDLMGHKLTKIIPENEHDAAMKRHDDTINHRRKNFGEILILKKNGSLMNVMVTSSMMELKNGRAFRITTVTDVTALKQIESDLRIAKDEADKANRAKSAFLANMSHELRTPLNAIIGFSEMMLNATLGKIENENYLEYLGDIKFSARHLLQIINDVLDMSKIEAGKMPLDEEVIDLPALLDSVKRLLRSNADEKDVAINLTYQDDMPALRGDERLLRQVFLNLISNAVKFSDKGGKVDINIHQEDGFIVKIEDEGIGIAENRLAEVIEPFGQVIDPKLNKGQGTGLGLPIAKAMMDMHGGTLEIQSQSGQGTLVTCHFPETRVINET